MSTWKPIWRDERPTAISLLTLRLGHLTQSSLVDGLFTLKLHLWPPFISSVIRLGSNRILHFYFGFRPRRPNPIVHTGFSLAFDKWIKTFQGGKWSTFGVALRIRRINNPDKRGFPKEVTA